MELLLGIDVGTTTCKAALATPDGTEVAHGRRLTPWRPVPTGAEVDPLALAETAAAAALDALSTAPKGAVLGVGVTSMGETGVLLDAHGAPLATGIAWHDSRGSDEAERIGAEIGAAEFARHTGLPLGSAWTIAKYASLRAGVATPGRGRRWLSVAEWIVRWLGGEEVAELSLASRTGFLEVTTRGWWSTGLEWAGLSARSMPVLVEAGTAAGRVTRIPELAGAVLTVAGHDQPCGAVDRDTIESATARGLTGGCHVLPGRAALLGFFKAGLALHRFLRLLGADDAGERRAALDEDATAVPERAGGLLVTDIAGDIATITGIGAEVVPGAVWRAAMEAAASESARIVSSVDDIAGRTERLVVTGGWARSEAYRAIKRAVQGPFDWPDISEAAARGAALFGGLSAGVYASADEFPIPRSRFI